MTPSRSGRRRRTPARYRRRRLLVALGAAALVALVAVGISKLVGARGSPGGDDAPSASAPATGAGSVKLVARTTSTPLPQALSGESLVAQDGRLLVIGGLDSSDASMTDVLSIDPRSGETRPAATLAQPLHDAAAAPLGDGTLVFGGGASTSTDTVQSVRFGQGSGVTGHLPTVRSDLAAVALGGRAYVLGGYDGSQPIPAVLSTTDGRRFAPVASLPVPVRYPAVATSQGAIYVFGGETASGKPTDAIQRVDVQSGDASVIGHLPQPLDHASAVALGSRIYVLGGSVGGTASSTILAFDPASNDASTAGKLPMPVSNAAATTVGGTGYLVGGLGADGQPLSSIIAISEKTVSAPASSTQSSDQSAQPAPSSSVRPFAGRLLIADRGNNRLLLVNKKKQIVWQYPGQGKPPPPGGFYFPDDAFFTHGGHGIISNQEGNETIVQLAFPSGKVTWQYGHPHVIGSSPGYLHEPDDAYLLKDGTVTVADAQNCRILFINQAGKITQQIGTPTNCTHNPPSSLASPNGDTPLPNGDVLVSEVNGSYLDEITAKGQLVWSVHLPIAYPSDPQRIGPDRYLVADYTNPGGIYEFDREGHVLWSYTPTSGDGMLDHPSLAVQLPNGLIAVNDDYRDRVVLIDPKTKRIVWQYGKTDQPGTAPGLLNTPDGLDLLGPGGTTPAHPYTG